MSGSARPEVSESTQTDAAPARDNREAILEATARTIASHGVRGLRVEDVAAAAGVSAGLLYYHFENRAGLVRAALERASDQAPSGRMGSASTQLSGYQAVFDALIGELDDDPAIRDNAIVWGEVAASAVFSPELREDVARVTGRWHETVADGLRRGIEDGSIRADVDPEIWADLLTSTLDGLCNRWLAGAMPLERARRVMAKTLERELRPTGG